MNSNSDSAPSFLALGKLDEFVFRAGESDGFGRFQSWLENKKEWVFGGISYDNKNVIENLVTSRPNQQGFPLLHFIRPKIVLRRLNNLTEVLTNHSDIGNDELLSLRWDTAPQPDDEENKEIILTPVITRDQYLHAIIELQRHIQLGSIYEVNYCQEFVASNVQIDTFNTWCKLNALTQAPFSCYVKLNQLFVMCASPERFLKKQKGELISQPIKGTIRRGNTTEEDERLKNILRNSEKDKSENVMIVDLVRNDLSKHALNDSVEVSELFGIHTFKTVHHMISTIKAEVDPSIEFTQLLRDAFPMGSMTGAPKIRAMELIDEFEHQSRGWFSGSVGYISPEGDFDFNVVIRSLFYNLDNKRLSCLAGGAITALSNPEDEYHESLLKAEAMIKAMKTSN